MIMTVLCIMAYLTRTVPHSLLLSSLLTEHYPLTGSVMHCFRLGVRKLEGVASSTTTHSSATGEKVTNSGAYTCTHVQFTVLHVSDRSM